MARHPSTPPSARLSADADALYERITPLLGRWSERTVVTGEHGPVLPGTVLGDRDWLADRVADADARWNCPDSRTAATLWWYSASVTVVAGWPAAALTGADGPDLDRRGSG